MILPMWIAALLLAAAPVWLLWPTTTGTLPLPPGLTVFGPFGLGLLLLAITPFGQEFNLGTFSLAMAQPVARRRIWLVKTTVLAVALVLVLVVLCVSCLCRADVVLENLKNTSWGALYNDLNGAQQLQKLIRGSLNNVFATALTMGGLFVLLVYTGGLWTTLAFRQMSPAFWFTLLTPMLLSLVSGWVFSGLPSGIGTAASTLVFILYAGWGFLWARRNFLGAQDVQWTGGSLALRAARVEPISTAAVAPPKYRPLRALVWKEFQSHYVNLLVAGGLLVAHLAIIGVRKLNPDLRALHQSVYMILDIWWLLWLAMPLLVGAVAVAEERRLGTMEGHLSLPVRRRLQFAVKFAVVLLLGTLLGGVMPCLVEWLGTLIGVHSGLLAPLSRSVGLWQASFPKLLAPFLAAPELLAPFLAAAALAVLSFYASTMMRNTLQALAAAVVMDLGIWALIRAAGNPRLFAIPLWQGPLVYCVAAAVLLLNVFVLGYHNYKRLHETARLVRRNSLGWSLSLLVIFCSTTAIYNRVWEAWIPVEPTHPAYSIMLIPRNVSGEAPRTRLVASRYRIATRLPEGMLWLRQRRVKLREVPYQGQVYVVATPTGPWRQDFVEGRHWRDVAVSDAHTYAIKDNGSLWDLTGAVADKNKDGSGLKRIGADNSWEQIAAGRNLFIGIKADGSLWEWGYRTGPGMQVEQKLAAPTRIGADSNWVAVAASADSYAAMKSDGSFWTWGEWHVCTNGVCGVLQTSRQPQQQTSGWGFRSAASGSQPISWTAVRNEKPVSLSVNGSSLAAVCSDGTLWVDKYMHSKNSRIPAHAMVRLGSDSDWKQVAVTLPGEIIATRADGSLWRATCGNGYSTASRRTTLSEYSDWFAVTSRGNTAITLSSDGKVCQWVEPAEYVRHNEWLARSRIMARDIANIDERALVMRREQ